LAANLTRGGDVAKITRFCVNTHARRDENQRKGVDRRRDGKGTHSGSKSGPVPKIANA